VIPHPKTVLQYFKSLPTIRTRTVPVDHLTVVRTATFPERHVLEDGVAASGFVGVAVNSDGLGCTQECELAISDLARQNSAPQAVACSSQRPDLPPGPGHSRDGNTRVPLDRVREILVQAIERSRVKGSTFQSE
jgi:hypothetical protein